MGERTYVEPKFTVIISPQGTYVSKWRAEGGYIIAETHPNVSMEFQMCLIAVDSNGCN